MQTLSKKAQAIALYSRVVGTNKDDRSAVVHQLVAKVGLTEQGAQTYYSNMKNGVWPLTPGRHTSPPNHRASRGERLFAKAKAMLQDETIRNLSISELNAMYAKLTGEEQSYHRPGVVINRIRAAVAHHAS